MYLFDYSHGSLYLQDIQLTSEELILEQLNFYQCHKLIVIIILNHLPAGDVLRFKDSTVKLRTTASASRLSCDMFL